MALDSVPDPLYLHQIDAVTDESHGGNLAVPGPADREHFLAAQARNRRATWRLTALAPLAVVLMGVPMSVVISPLVYAALFVLNDAVNLVVPTPDLLYLAAHLDQNPSWTVLPELTRNALVFAALVLSGSVVMLLAWLGARVLFLSAGPDGILRALGAREPRMGDLEEQQLRNVVAEMAIAGGVKPPRVLLLDGTAANAAAVGSSPDDATIIVSRRLLDELDREDPGDHRSPSRRHRQRGSPHGAHRAAVARPAPSGRCDRRAAHPEPGRAGAGTGVAGIQGWCRAGRELGGAAVRHRPRG